MRVPTRSIVLIILCLFSWAAKAQIPSVLNISWDGNYGNLPVGQLLPTPTTRPPGTTTQRATFMFRGTSYFHNPTQKWQATGHHLAVIMRGPGYLNGRGVIIGNVHRAAEGDPSYCRFPATMQVEVFGNLPYAGAPPPAYTGGLFRSTCLNQRERLLDGVWYKVVVSVDNTDKVSYSVDEVTSTGVTVRTIASLSTNTTIAGDPPDGTHFALLATTGVGGLPYERPPFTVEIKNLSVVWL